MSEKINRYPGVNPFSEEQKEVFFGRKSDIQKISNLILVRKQVLLYSKSGVGKTSILMAGLLPELPERYVPLKIRFTSYTGISDTSPVQRIILELKKLDVSTNGQTILDKIIENTRFKKNLWYYFKQQQLIDNKKTFLLVFDQFEELFTYPKDRINEFKEELYELLQADIPSSIVELLDQSPEIGEIGDLCLLESELNIKTIYSIRSDRLNMLNFLSDKISNIQRDFYELKSLTLQQAREAIEVPAQIIDEKYLSPSFNFEPRAIDKIINKLTKDGTEKIEATQLQIVCNRIEENLPNQSDDGKIVVKESDIPEFKNIFLDFYNDAISFISEEHRSKARELVEDKLIINQSRISLDGRICTGILSEKELQKLVNKHLLRSESNTTRDFNYELSHDILIEPILEASAERHQQEEEALAQAEQQEQILKIRKKAEKERKRQRQIIFIISNAAVISIMMSIWALVNKNKAENALSLADSLKNRAIEDKIKTDSMNLELKKTQYNYFIKEAESYIDKRKYQEAVKSYNNARPFALDIVDSIEITTGISNCESNKSDLDKSNEILAKAKEMFNEQKYEMAFELYKEALVFNQSLSKIQNDLNRLKEAFIAKVNSENEIANNYIYNKTKQKEHRENAKKYTKLINEISEILAQLNSEQ